jgi:hypothetical protein
MTVHVKRGEIDRDNNPVGDAQRIASFEDRAAAQAFIEGEIAKFDHNGFVPDGPQVGWWGRNDRDPFEKFHFWIDGEPAGEGPNAAGPSGSPAQAINDPNYRGLP